MPEEPNNETEEGSDDMETALGIIGAIVVIAIIYWGKLGFDSFFGPDDDNGFW